MAMQIAITIFTILNYNYFTLWIIFIYLDRNIISGVANSVKMTSNSTIIMLW